MAEAKHTPATEAEKRAFAAGWNARETGSGHRADGRESCLGMFVRGFNFGDTDTGEDISRRPSVEAELLAALKAWQSDHRSRGRLQVATAEQMHRAIAKAEGRQ